ncbi:putative Ig domain-containing protein [Corynebacterium jeikeium]|uniref:putative Ig domain-containing protein n=1 Tax=Corynebacterium jeikeium TaxID=38289 RepID=UPI000DA309D7|nr:putative Ig domain-containing protein [Corynebacterium jeikeium]SQI18977.1 cell surface protein [Corynebacterium jeikeium]
MVVEDPDLPGGKVEVEVPVTDHEKDRDDNGSEKTKVEGDPKPVDPTDEKQDTGVDIVNKDDDTKVSATDEDGKKVPVEVDEDGNVHVTPGTDVDGPITVVVEDPDLPGGKVEVEVPVTDHEKDRDDNGSEKTKVEGDPKPVDPTDEKQDTGVDIVNKDDDTKVSATDEDGKKVPVEVDEDGNVHVTPGTDVDGPITVVVEDPDLPGGKVEVEVPVTDHEKDRDDNGSEKTKVEGDPKPVDPTDEKQDTGVDIVNKDDDTKVSATDEDGKKVPVEVDEDGNVHVTPGTDVDGPITVVVEDPDLPGGKVEVEVPVTDHEKDRDDNGSEKTKVEGDPKPVDPTDEKQDTGVDIVNKDDDTKVSATDEDGKKVPVEVDEDGNVHVTPGTDVDGPITVVVEDPDLPGGKVEVEVPVTDHEKDRDDNGSEKTKVEGDPKPVDPTDEKQDTGVDIVNKDDDTKVSATDEDGKKVPVEVDEDGNVHVTPGTDVDGPITVVVEDPDLPGGKVEVEVPVTDHEKDRDDNGSGKTKVEGDPKPVDPTDEKQDTGVDIVNKDDDTKVSATDEDGKKVPVEVDEDGNVHVTPGTDVDGPITVVVEDPDLPGGKVEVEVPVTDHEKDRDDNGSDTPPAPDASVITDKVTVVEGQDADPFDTAKNVPEGGKVEVENLPGGLTVDPNTGEVSGTPNKLTDWGPEEERDVTVTVTITDKDGKEVAKEDKVITVQRDTDNDGEPDVTDTDDDGDGYTDEEEKEKGSDPKDENSFPAAPIEPGIPNPLVITDKVTVVEGQDADPFDTAKNVPEGGKVEVENLPGGLTVDPNTGEVSGTPNKLTDWGPEEEERDVTVTVTITDKDGKEVAKEDKVITVQRDTDNDGEPDVTDPDDDNDGVSDEDEKEAGTDPKDPNDKPQPDAPAKGPKWEDTTTTPDKPVEIPNTGGDVPAGTTVEVKGPGKAKIDENGKITVTPDKDAKPGDKVVVVVKDKDGKVIDEVTVTVTDKDDQGGNQPGGSSGSLNDPNKIGAIIGGTIVGSGLIGALLGNHDGAAGSAGSSAPGKPGEAKPGKPGAEKPGKGEAKPGEKPGKGNTGNQGGADNGAAGNQSAGKGSTGATSQSTEAGSRGGSLAVTGVSGLAITLGASVIALALGGALMALRRRQS